MSIPLEQIKDLQLQAQVDRKRGDALSRAGNDPGALKAYEAGSSKLKSALEILDAIKWQSSPALAAERAELLGSLGGFAQRLRRPDEALDWYEKGAGVEHDNSLASTYNRVNEIKYSLLTGRQTLAALEPRIRFIADSLAGSLRADQALSDSGWAWADIGDCFALLGELDEAGRAYGTFVAKADMKSPERTLDVLKDIASAMERNKDPGADRVADAIRVLEVRLTAR